MPPVIEDSYSDQDTVSQTDVPSDATRRAAALAVSRFGADRKRVHLAVQTAIQALGQGIEGDVVDLLVVQKLLTPAQADELREELKTLPPDDPSFATPPPPISHKTPIVPATPVDPIKPSVPVKSGQFPRNLGSYRLLRRIAEGGMGSVFLAFDDQAKQQVAIKVLSDPLARNEAYVERFLREAKSGAALDHPNIVRCISAGRDDASGKHYLVMEYVNGPSARSLLDKEGRLLVGDATRICLDIARALEHVHARNFVHRDIKPDNILISSTGVAKLADLGLAKRTDETSHLTGNKQGFGTPYYMPCEQATDAKFADARTDIFALGATLYHLLTGEVPFPGETQAEVTERKLAGIYPLASSLNPNVPPALDEILKHMLARNPMDRYPTARDLVRDLERTELSARVPSYTDPDLILDDDSAKQRLQAPLQATRLDFDANGPAPKNGAAATWIIRYRRTDGTWHHARATKEQIETELRSGLIPRSAEASVKDDGQFQPLVQIAELSSSFGPDPTPSASIPSWAIVGLIALILATFLIVTLGR